MPELRWILLILGIAFIGALAWWELRRQRRLPAPPEEHVPHHFREPALGLPEIRPRERVTELPVVEIEEDSMIGLRIDGVRIEESMQADGPQTSGEAQILEESHEAMATPPVAPLPESGALPVPIVEWPPEEQRKLLSLRIVAQPGARFGGRALRLALSADGFVLGKFSIFHKPDANAHAIVSAASLTQPGTFDAETMDTCRYGGLSIFAVLPGPLPDPQMFDELLTAARSLNARLEGVLQDEHGETLTAMHAAELREKLDLGAPP